MDQNKAELINVKNLTMKFPYYRGAFKTIAGYVNAVDDVSFSIKKGETLGVLGESGCGKTTLGRCVVRLQKPTSGTIEYILPDGSLKEVDKFTKSQSFEARRQVQIVFQDPYSSFNPMITVAEAMEDPLIAHGIKDIGQRRKIIGELLEKVNLAPDCMFRYPHEFSGGQLQRVSIARALSINPDIIVCDEPVSALDVSIQAQVLNLLKDIQEEKKLSYMFIAHDLSVVEYMSDRIAVMYLGKFVEIATSDRLYHTPQHPYTEALLSAVPTPVLNEKKERIILQGDVPSPMHLPTGCRFHPRCWKCKEICKQKEPELKPVRGEKDHFVRCHFADI